MNCILIDDEKSSRQTLRNILEKYCIDIHIMDEADSLESAYESILKNKPELVFLDIELTDGTAFNLLDRFDTINFHIIFTTAYEQYAINAIKVEAADYLLKPLSITELVKAVDKLKRKVKVSSDKNELFQMLATFQTPFQQNPFIPIPTTNGYEMINSSDILYCEANELYTIIFLNNGTKRIVSKKIGDVELMLSPRDFFRSHHSYIVNRQYIKNYIRGEGGSALLSHNIEVPISKRTKSEFIEWLKAE